mgnify:CR=1 FL=1
MTITTYTDREIALQKELALANQLAQMNGEIAAELKAERDKLRQRIKHIGNDALQSENHELRQQLAEAQRDAERYRHLFKGNKVYSSFMRAYGEWDGCGGKAGFDNSMDAAMKGTA